MKFKVGDLVRYNDRYDNEIYYVIDIEENLFISISHGYHDSWEFPENFDLITSILREDVVENDI